MKKISGKRSEDDAKIDLTPMLDVVFILLIFFVVTATFLSETSISAASSDNNNNETPPEDTDKKNILFEIGPNNEIILNGNPRPIIATQVRSNIDQLKAENPAASVIIQPDNSSEVSTLVMIVDAAQIRQAWPIFLLLSRTDSSSDGLTVKNAPRKMVRFLLGVSLVVVRAGRIAGSCSGCDQLSKRLDEMKNLWNQSDAAACNSELDLRVYSSRLLGAAPSLVLHGGGNTSVKAEFTNVFSESVPALYIKGSGWDLRTIEAAGFPPVDLAYLQRLGALAELSDTDMMRQLRLALLDPAGPTPSVEAILHAIIPCKYVDAPMLMQWSLVYPSGTELLQDLLGDEVLILPYTMPGFVLARQVAEATLHADWERLKGIVLLHHGIFTFHEEAEQSYSNMIELVSMAEKRLATRSVLCGSTKHLVASGKEELALAKLREAASQLLVQPCWFSGTSPNRPAALLRSRMLLSSSAPPDA